MCLFTCHYRADKSPPSESYVEASQWNSYTDVKIQTIALHCVKWETTAGTLDNIPPPSWARAGRVPLVFTSDRMRMYKAACHLSVKQG